VKKNEVLGMMHIQSGQASVGIIERELRHLCRDVRNGVIKQMGEDNRYMVTFSSEEMRYQVAKFISFEFETVNVRAKVIPTEMSAKADRKLESVWVRAHKFPNFARKVEVVMEVSYIVGDLEEVDLTTLNRPGPVRIKIACVDVTMIRGAI
jgi:cytochrome c556